MKKSLIAIAMVLTLSMNADAAAQNHRHTPRTEQVDSTKNNQDAIEAFSDTTAVSDAEDAEDDQYIRNRQVYQSDDMFKSVFDNLDKNEITGILFVLAIVLILFVLAPIGIIIAVFYFINKNRRERYKLAQMAMQNGQPIPDDLLKEKQANWDRSDYQTGMRQMFTGVGLAIFLGIVAGQTGFGIGALVFFIGLGKWFIARKSMLNSDSQFNNGSNNNGNQSNIYNYDKETDAL